MTLATCLSRAQIGIDAPAVWVETHLTGGLPSYSIVGLPEAGVRESKDRVRSALMNARFDFPCERITTNLAPADIPKEGGRFDLAIAVSILAASEQINCTDLDQYEFVAELGLAGQLRPVKGVLPAAMACHQNHRTLVIAHENAAEASLVSGLKVVSLNSLLEVSLFLQGQTPLNERKILANDMPPPSYPDFKEVVGQYQAKRALEIAAAGGHNLLMVGPPGSGKTMLANRLPGLLPQMSDTQALESAVIQSVSAQGFNQSNWRRRLVRTPHHSASVAALVGGGSKPKPGEVSLAHAGILFLDELPEFDRRVLESLREPVENGHITISRAASQTAFPAQFQLIAAMNPCPCGYFGQNSKSCRCSVEQVKRYLNKLSGPLLDRIDLHIQVAAVKPQDLAIDNPDEESSADIRQRVLNAYNKQQLRADKSNARLTAAEIKHYCNLEKNAKSMLEMAMNKLQLSARSYHRLIKVAQTIADLDDCDRITSKHMAETLTYRQESALPIKHH